MIEYRTSASIANRPERTDQGPFSRPAARRRPLGPPVAPERGHELTVVVWTTPRYAR